MKELEPSVRTGILYADGIVNVWDYAKKTVGADALHPLYYNIDVYKRQGVDFTAGKAAMTLGSTASLKQYLEDVNGSFEIGTAYYPLSLIHI